MSYLMLYACALIAAFALSATLASTTSVTPRSDVGNIAVLLGLVGTASLCTTGRRTLVKDNSHRNHKLARTGENQMVRQTATGIFAECKLNTRAGMQNKATELRNSATERVMKGSNYELRRNCPDGDIW
jgi:hypothetical protein